MLHLVTRVVRVVRRVRKGVVKRRFAHVGLEPVDFFQGRVAVEGHAVGTPAHNRSVRFVQPPELEVPIALPGVVKHVGIGDLGKERARVLSQRVEEEAVDDDAGDLEGKVRQ